MVTPLQRYSDSAPVLTPEGNIGLQSHSLKELMPAKIQCNMIIKDVIRNKDNPYFKSKYSTLDSVLRDARKIYASNGLDITQSTAFHNNQILLVSQITHISGEFIRSTTPIVVDEGKGNSPAQKMGAAMTFLKRKILLGMMCIAETDEIIEEEPIIEDPGDDDDNINIALQERIEKALEELATVNNADDLKAWIVKCKDLKQEAETNNLGLKLKTPFEAKRKILQQRGIIDE